MNNIESRDTPVSIKNYKILDTGSLPKTYLCINVKSKFDEDRARVKSKYTPQSICHFKTTTQLVPVFLHGIEIDIKKEYKSLVSRVVNKGYTEINEYKHTLKEYKLSCDTCYGYITDGICSIDLKHLSDISSVDYASEIQSGFKDFIDNNTYPWYVSIPTFNILVLYKSSGYTDNKL